MSMNSKNKILIYGGGGIGSYYAGALSNNGHNVTLLTRGNHFEEIKKTAQIPFKSLRRSPLEIINRPLLLVFLGLSVFSYFS